MKPNREGLRLFGRVSPPHEFDLGLMLVWAENEKQAYARIDKMLRRHGRPTSAVMPYELHEANTEKTGAIE